MVDGNKESFAESGDYLAVLPHDREQGSDSVYLLFPKKTGGLRSCQRMHRPHSVPNLDHQAARQLSVAWTVNWMVGSAGLLNLVTGVQAFQRQNLCVEDCCSTRVTTK